MFSLACHHSQTLFYHGTNAATTTAGGISKNVDGDNISKINHASINDKPQSRQQNEMGQFQRQVDYLLTLVAVSSSINPQARELLWSNERRRVVK
jgi:hypothetical protein